MSVYVSKEVDVDLWLHLYSTAIPHYFIRVIVLNKNLTRWGWRIWVSFVSSNWRGDGAMVLSGVEYQLGYGETTKK